MIIADRDVATEKPNEASPCDYNTGTRCSLLHCSSLRVDAMKYAVADEQHTGEQADAGTAAVCSLASLAWILHRIFMDGNISFFLCETTYPNSP